MYLLKSMPAIKKLPFCNNVLFFKQGVHLDLIISPVFEKQLSCISKKIHITCEEMFDKVV